jgi:PIN like domain
MSSARQPEFFFDRSLGKASARRLRDEGWIVHLIAEFYEADATNVADEEWIAEQTRRGWILLPKDKKRRYRAHELEALTGGHLFCLASGSLALDEMAQRFVDAGPAMLRAISQHPADSGML